MVADTNNGRVTLAILNTKLDYVIAGQDALRQDVKGVCDEQGEIKERVTRNEERIGNLAKVAMGFPVIGSIIAAVIGVAK